MSRFLTTLRPVGLRFVAFLLALWPGAGKLPAEDVPKPAASAGGACVLTTYLTPPPRIAHLQRVANDANVELHFLSAEDSSDDPIRDKLAACRIVLMDVPHPSVGKRLIDRFGSTIQQHRLPYVVIGEFDAVVRGEATALDPLQSEHSVDSEIAKRIREYWRFGGKRNTRLLIDALQRDRFDEGGANASLADAVPLPLQGVYRPDWSEVRPDLESALLDLEQGGWPVVAIAINRAVLTSDDTAWLDRLIAALDKRGLTGYAFYGPRDNGKLFYQMTHADVNGSERAVAHLLINAAQVFRPNERKAELDRIGLPVLQTLPALAMDAEQWRASKEGLALADISYYYASSELAGMVDPVLVSARDSTTGVLEAIPSQIEAVADKAEALTRLQRTPRASRRIAFVVYNYPLGEANFGASFLNVPKSLSNILTAMQNAGYQVDPLEVEQLTVQVQQALRASYDLATLQTQLAEGSAMWVPLDAYEKWFRSLPSETQQRIESYWGAPEETATQAIRTGQRGFAIPIVRSGNAVILAQPLRYEITAGVDDETRRKRIGHRSSVPLSHHYLATYLWVREQWRANAVVHLGTHGTVEWAPGKERGLAADDDPYLALGSLPNIYPYIMDNLGEAMTAKRRGRAVMVSHLTPMFSPAGFRPGLHEMHDLMHDWEITAAGPVREQIQQRLIDLFVEHKLDKDLGWTREEIRADFQAFMERLHPYLDDIAQAAQPQGLAVFGEAPDSERRLAMVMQMLRKPLIDVLGEDIDEVFLLDYEKVINSRPARWLRLALSDPEAASQIDLRKIDALAKGKPSSVPNRAEGKELDSAQLLALAHRARELDAALASNDELAGLLAALDGKHIAASYGGDPVRNPESLPTGRNLYGFDPSRVPTRQAWELGKAVLDDWLEEYREQHAGQMPQKLAYSLWAGETMRHQGVMEAQVLYALGAEPRWDDAGRVTGIELIPPEELQRDRIDVLLSVTGSYRDQFPLVIQWIDLAVQQVADLNEPGNPVAASTERIRQDLMDTGIEAERASRMATARIFSSEPGVYGTALNDAVAATDLWRSQTAQGGDTEMARLFVDRMGFAYGSDLDGAMLTELFTAQLSEVDAAFASRSSSTYGMLTSDDPFAYIGGLSLASRIFSDHTPELFIQNLRDESEVIIDPAARAIAKEMQTRYLHPQWIKSQQAEGYSGTLQVLKTAQFLWGWQVTAPETIREDQWQALHDVYVKDQYQLGSLEWLQRDNPAALAQMLERMLDAVRLGYWRPDEATRTSLVNTYEEARQASQLIESNPAVRAFVQTSLSELQPLLPDARASGPVSDAHADAKVASATSPVSNTDQTQATESKESVSVQGLELRPQPLPQAAAQEPSDRWALWVRGGGVALMSLLVILGACRQYYRFSRRAGTEE